MNGVNHDLDTLWWRCRQVVFAVFFRALLFWGVVTVVSLSYWIVREWVENRSASWTHIRRIIEDSYLGCAALGLVFGYGFGIPLGIVQVLGIRARQLDLEQELESDPSRDRSP